MMNKSESYKVMADTYLLNAQNSSLDYSDRIFNILQATEFYLKSFYYEYFPFEELRGHISSELIYRISNDTGLPISEEALYAVDLLKPHYLGTRYPEVTSDIFGCVETCQTAINHYQLPQYDEILKYAKILIDWVGASV